MSLKTNVMFFSASLISVLLFNACSPVASHNESNSEGDVAISAISNNLKYSDEVGSEKVTALNESISSLYNLQLSSNGFDLYKIKNLMHLESVTNSSLQEWIEERVKYIVSENYNLDKNIELSNVEINYQFKNEIPDVYDGVSKIAEESASSGDAKVMMSNIGAALYYVGKKFDRLMDLNISGIGKVHLSSPRVGVLKIGEGLFPNLEGISIQNIALDFMRLTTLFHEARHSDGHGKSLSFFHVKCPKGHDYEGIPACDASINGPYSIEEHMIKLVKSSCTDCTIKSKKFLDLLYLDVASRKVSYPDIPVGSKETLAGTEWKDEPEGIDINE